MRRLTTVICCVCFAIVGITLTYDQSPLKIKPGGLPVMASEANPVLPFDLFMDQIKNSQVKSDTVQIPERVDTVYLPGKTVTKWKTRYVSTHSKPRGSEIMPMKEHEKSQSMVREEKTKELVDSGYQQVDKIKLLINDNVVYNSENDNHSTSVAPQQQPLATGLVH